MIIKKIETKRLVIRKFSDKDIDGLYKLLSNEQVMRYIEKPYTFDQTLSFLKKYALTITPSIFAVDNKDGNFVGYIIYHPYDTNSYEIGWILHQKFWNKGYAQELTEKIIENAKKIANKLIIECDEKQEISIKIARRNNFKLIRTENGCKIFELNLK